ncbi:hypothetical protein Nepgr_028032 [Nepenthes gracilis]|uniref:Uncharacterized protein n=1 Tax=Nepenthes gracilis TaxID=150966 RepID=A0AAD3Y3P9_NEPGR|nr:hypothetical protein Nepgr_028032 [Nepenthes gracilis]
MHKRNATQKASSPYKLRISPNNASLTRGITELGGGRDSSRGKAGGAPPAANQHGSGKWGTGGTAMKKAPGGNGYISRQGFFEEDLAGYFHDLHCDNKK